MPLGTIGIFLVIYRIPDVSVSFCPGCSQIKNRYSIQFFIKCYLHCIYRSLQMVGFVLGFASINKHLCFLSKSPFVLKNGQTIQIFQRLGCKLFFIICNLFSKDPVLNSMKIIILLLEISWLYYISWLHSNLHHYHNVKITQQIYTRTITSFQMKRKYSIVYRFYLQYIWSLGFYPKPFRETRWVFREMSPGTQWR